MLEGMLRTCVLDHKGIGLIALNGIRLQTIVIRREYRWHSMRHGVGGHVDHRYVGPRWERTPSRVLIWLETPLRR